jgi:hypothetical protein
MESAGEEKAIRTLFHELKDEDLNAAPMFDRQWAAAVAAQADRTRPGLRLWAPVLAFSSLCVVVALAAVILRHHSSSPTIAKTEPPAPTKASPPKPETAVTPETAAVSPPPTALKSPPRRVIPARKASLIVPGLARRIDRVPSLSRWQSPTAALLQSPDSVMLGATPVINGSARELKSFLPDHVK